jgi:hypothetical protein
MITKQLFILLEVLLSGLGVLDFVKIPSAVQECADPDNPIT